MADLRIMKLADILWASYLTWFSVLLSHRSEFSDFSWSTTGDSKFYILYLFATSTNFLIQSPKFQVLIFKHHRCVTSILGQEKQKKCWVEYYFVYCLKWVISIFYPILSRKQ